MLQTFSKYGSSEFLRDQVQEIVLESFGNPADHRHGNGSQQQPGHPIIMTGLHHFFHHPARFHFNHFFRDTFIKEEERIPAECNLILVVSSQINQPTENNGIHQGEPDIHGRQE